MTNEQQARVLENMRLVSCCAAKFRACGVAWDELCACGNLGLVQAAITFRPEKNTRFSTYACRCIDNEIYMMLRQRKKHNKVVASLDEELSGTEGLCFHDVLPDDTDITDAVETKLLAADAVARISRLPTKKRRVWELRFGLAGEPPMKQAEIAQRLGCSRSLISRALKQDINFIKGVF